MLALAPSHPPPPSAMANDQQEFILRVKKKGDLEYFIGRRYGEFSRLQKALHTELPGRVLPTLPKKNKTSTTTSSIIGAIVSSNDSDASSVSSVSTQMTQSNDARSSLGESLKNLTIRGE